MRELRAQLREWRQQVESALGPDGMRFLTCCVDGHHRDAVREAVHRAGLREGARCMHYLTFLRE